MSYKTEIEIQKLLLAKIIKDFENNDLAYNYKLHDYIAEQLQKYKEIKEGLRGEDKELAEAKKEYESKVKIIQTRWKLLKEGKLKCDCPVTHYYPDAAGGFSSHEECAICGKEI